MMKRMMGHHILRRDTLYNEVYRDGETNECHAHSEILILLVNSLSLGAQDVREISGSAWARRCCSKPVREVQLETRCRLLLLLLQRESEAGGSG